MGASADHRAARRDEIRRRLLRAVDQLTVGGDSYATVSVERLATAAGLSRATFYTYFNGKADLLTAWGADTVSELADAGRAWLSLGAHSREGDARDALRILVDAYRPRANLIGAIGDEATQDGSLRDLVTGAIDRTIGAVANQIEQGQADGWIDPELLAPETAAWMVWLLERGLQQVVPAADEPRLQALIATLAGMGWRTLRRA